MNKTDVMLRVAAGQALEAFTFVPDDGGPEVRYNISALREMMKAGAPGGELVWVAMDQVEDFLRNNRVWEQARVDALSYEEYTFDPAITLLEGEGDSATYCFVDGVHRILRRAQEGMVNALVWTFPANHAPRILPDSGFVPGPDWGSPLSSLKRS